MFDLSVWARRAAWLALGLGLTAASPAFAAAFDANADYVVSLAGVNFANANVEFREDGRRFSIAVGANVTGVGSLVTSGTASAESRGLAGNGELDARDFDLETRSGGDSFSVAVQYASGNATGFRVDPPMINQAHRVAIERKDLKDVTDPLGSFILKGDALGPDLCNRRLKVFTGVERYDIAMRYAQTTSATSERTGYQGPVVLCALKYIPISGHFETSEMTRYLANSDRILIWYAPLGQTGYFIPYRVLMGTSAGDLSMVLVGLK